MDFRSGNPLVKRNKVMSPEQFNQIVEAITEGRYSWACVLILRFAGYNPVYFIPYRTYSRLVKENQRVSRVPDACPNQNPHPDQRQSQPLSAVSIGDLSALQNLSSGNDLSTIETTTQPEGSLYGGLFVVWLEEDKDHSLFQHFLRDQSFNFYR
jgi:hypothetical protein